MDNSSTSTHTNNNALLPGIKQAFIIIIIYALIAIITGPLVALLSKAIPFLKDWQMLLSFVISFGILLPIAMRIWDSYEFEQKKFPFLQYLILFPGIIALSIVVESMVSLIPMPEAVLNYFAKMVQMNLPGYLTVGIAAPILEELIFRGIILKGLLKKYDARKAIIWSAAIFGIAHLNPWQFIAAFTVGIAIGYMYWKTKSIWPGIFIHFVNNSFSFYLGYQAGDINVSFSEFVGGTTNYLIILALSIIICLIVIKHFIHTFKTIKIH